MKKNAAGQAIGAEMITAADGSAFTGAVTVYVTGDAGTQAIGSVGSGVCTHKGNGYHTYAPAQAESNYDLVAFTFIGTGAIPATLQVYTTFPQSANAPTANENADALLKRDWTAITGEASRSVLNALRFLRNKWSAAGTTLTVTKEDDVTTAWTGNLTTNPSADPITGNDPT